MARLNSLSELRCVLGARHHSKLSSLALHSVRRTSSAVCLESSLERPVASTSCTLALARLLSSSALAAARRATRSASVARAASSSSNSGESGMPLAPLHRRYRNLAAARVSWQSLAMSPPLDLVAPHVLPSRRFGLPNASTGVASHNTSLTACGAENSNAKCSGQASAMPERIVHVCGSAVTSTPTFSAAAAS